MYIRPLLALCALFETVAFAPSRPQMRSIRIKKFSHICSTPSDDLDNHADQMNPNNDEYWHIRDIDRGDDDDDYDDDYDDDDDDDVEITSILKTTSITTQINDEYWRSRG